MSCFVCMFVISGICNCGRFWVPLQMWVWLSVNGTQWQWFRCEWWCGGVGGSFIPSKIGAPQNLQMCSVVLTTTMMLSSVKVVPTTTMMLNSVKVGHHPNLWNCQVLQQHVIQLRRSSLLCTNNKTWMLGIGVVQWLWQLQLGVEQWNWRIHGACWQDHWTWFEQPNCHDSSGIWLWWEIWLWSCCFLMRHMFTSPVPESEKQTISNGIARRRAQRQRCPQIACVQQVDV